eukprot:TRINITY_DN17485_c0_g1_i1.p1 TRINITY_DN17485_c0_g1~~TRINITY_DN17485_c0_g1_i1.p1  ORF type:complete len:231 (+),score=55.68 TRINITY_DN17485_c0_g1_i1:59-751(+)
MSKSAVVIGVNGALGRSVCSAFQRAGYTVIGTDLQPTVADVNIPIDSAVSYAESSKQVAQKVSEASPKVDAVICVAGGWNGGYPKDDDVFTSLENMYNMNMKSALLAAHIASRFLKEDGLFVLTGASAALGPTPFMVAYGMTKAATHHLLDSVVADSNFPQGTRAVAILPLTLDTPSNRAAMPTADYSTWTPVDDIANKLVSWSDKQEAITSGDKYLIKTAEGVTSWTKA